MELNQQGLVVCKAKPRQCPVCKSKAIATYIFGYPDSTVFEDQERPILQQKYQIGGCCIEMEEFDKSWHCKQCRSDFYKKNSHIDWE